MLLLPANEVWGKVIFLHLSVILFTGGSTWAGTPPGRYTLLGRYTSPGRYTTLAGTPPQAGSPPPGRFTPQAGTPPGQVQAGSTHPT